MRKASVDVVVGARPSLGTLTMPDGSLEPLDRDVAIEMNDGRVGVTAPGHGLMDLRLHEWEVWGTRFADGRVEIKLAGIDIWQTPSPEETIAIEAGATLRIDGSTTIGVQGPDHPGSTPASFEHRPGRMTRELRSKRAWDRSDLDAAGIPVIESPFVLVGGGMGSFAFADYLRIHGVTSDDITILSPLTSPEQTYRYLAEASQIVGPDRLRSDSMSRIDNIWGFPGYSLTEARRHKSVTPLVRVLVEPVLSEFYTPPADLVYETLRLEARRIGWHRMLEQGQATVVRPCCTGGHFVVLRRPTDDGDDANVAFHTEVVHLALGYPSLRFLGDLRRYRRRQGTAHRVVNAYETHGQVYETLGKRGGRVIVRGSGIVASRVLERLLVVGETSGWPVEVIHLVRSLPDENAGPIWFRRPSANGFSYQPFSFPKAAGGGQLRARMLRMNPPERAELLRAMGGTNTARRQRWEAVLERGRADGSYRLVVGEVSWMNPATSGVSVGVATEYGTLQFEADFVLDATGLTGGVTDHPLVADLVEGGAMLNAAGGLATDRNFEVEGTRSGGGRVYAVGMLAQGGHLAPVDSFWGLGHAALDICDHLAREGRIRRLGWRRSTSQWWRWMRNRAP